MLKLRYSFKKKLKTIILIIFCAVLAVVYWKLLSNLDKWEVNASEPFAKAKSKVCSVNYNDTRACIANNKNLPVIYYVTPTYPRPVQVAELVRLSHTLMHVPSIHWVVADDHPDCSDVVLEVLRRSKLPYTHLSSPKPFKVRKNKPYARGVSNRLAALSWLKEFAKEGVLYFGDDDNTVDLQLFEEIRQTKKVSMVPVGLIGTFGVSSPLVKDGKVIGFFDSWLGNRKFAVDMAGFAVNLRFLKPHSSMPYTVGHEEDKFLVSLDLKLEDIEPMADNCSKVIVWHTKTQNPPKRILHMQMEDYPESDNLASLLQEVKHQDYSAQSSVSRLMSITPHVNFKDKLYYIFFRE